VRDLLAYVSQMAASARRQEMSNLLADLNLPDTGLTNSDSEMKQYELNPPLPRAEISSFESKHNVTLPADYRFFITEIGNGGAGPYCGLFPFGKEDGVYGFCAWEDGWLVGDLSKPFEHTEAWNPIESLSEKMPDLGPNATEDEEDEEWSRILNEYYWNPQIMNGAIPICHEGCSLRQWLVINGPQKGFVWRDRRADDFGIAPLLGTQNQQVTFAAWYMDWLTNLVEHYQTRAAQKSHNKSLDQSRRSGRNQVES